MLLSPEMTPNLYLPGTLPDGTPRTLVELPGFWSKQASDQRRGGSGDAYLPELMDAVSDAVGLHGIVRIDSIDVSNPAKPYIKRRILTHNVVTDNGAQALLKGLFVANQTIAQYLVLNTTAATSQITSAITAGATTVTSVSVASGGNAAAVTGNKAASYISNTTSTPSNGSNGGAADPTTGGGIVLSYGTPNADYVSGSATQSSATAIAIASATIFHAHAVNDWCVANPQTGDGPTSLPSSAIIYNSTASTNAATGTASPATVSGTGIGNRQAQFAVTYGTSSTAGSYSELWLATQSTIAALTAAADYVAHLSFSPSVLNSSTQISVTYDVKL